MDTLKRIFSEAKSFLFIKWALWSHARKNELPLSYTTAVAFTDEKESIENEGQEIFSGNIAELNRSDYGVDALIYCYDIQAVTAAFLRGIFLELLEKKFLASPSPTPIPHRAMVYAMTFYSKYMDMSFLEAREIILRTEEILNSKTSTLPLWKAVELGRQSYRDKNDQHLTAAHAFVATHLKYLELRKREKHS